MKQSAVVVERERETPLLDLAGDLWQVRHDVHRPGAGLRADHVVVGPAGVFVVEVVTWSGMVTVHDRVLRHEGRPRTEVATGLAAATAEVAGMLPSAPPGLVQPVLCVAGQSSLGGWADGVHVRAADRLVAWLGSLPAILGPAQVAALVAELEAVAEARQGPRRAQVLMRSASAEQQAPAAGRSRVVVRRWVAGGLVAVAALGACVVPQAGVAGHLGDLRTELVGLFGAGNPVAPEPVTGPDAAAQRRHTR